MSTKINNSNWDSRIRFRTCQEEGCSREFECKPYTNRKYCDICQDPVRDAKHQVARKKLDAKKKALPIINHEDCCGCGVESRRV